MAVFSFRPRDSQDLNARVADTIEDLREDMQAPPNVLAMRHYGDGDSHGMRYVAPDGEGLRPRDQHPTLPGLRDALVTPKRLGQVEPEVERAWVRVGGGRWVDVEESHWQCI